MREAAMMGAIYEEPFCTIAALGAENSAPGVLFQPRSVGIFVVQDSEIGE
jgi:hypothetical protein